MGFRRWLSKADANNQAVADALFHHPHVDGSGLIVVSRPSRGELGGYREGRSLLSIDGGKRIRLLWGSTFYPLEPGTHQLRFGWGRIARAEVTIAVPDDGRVRVEYQPAHWPWQPALVTDVDVTA